MRYEFLTTTKINDYVTAISGVCGEKANPKISANLLSAFATLTQQSFPDIVTWIRSENLFAMKSGKPAVFLSNSTQLQSVTELQWDIPE